MESGHNGDNWRQERELMQMRESLASALSSVERLLVDRHGMPPNKRLILSRAERRRVVQVGYNDGTTDGGDGRE